MPTLILKFNDSVLKEIPVVARELCIGRSPENAVVIDNPSVSNRHARVFVEAGRLMLEDFGSLNGTFVNGQRVRMTSLKSGDSVSIGKHTISISGEFQTGQDAFAPSMINLRPSAPKIDETAVLDTRERREFLQRMAAEGEISQIAPQRLRVPTLIVRKGKTDQREYLLSDKLTVIGKSAMATVKLKSWFAPKAAAQINRRPDNSYYVGAADRVPSVNGQPITHPTKLAPGDVLKVAGIEMEFVIRA